MGLFKKKKAVPEGIVAKDEIKTDAAIIGDSIHHISISPEEYCRITRQLNYNQLSQFTTMELVERFIGFEFKLLEFSLLLSLSPKGVTKSPL